jgi:enoyl-CoA hydratase/carnithine racemase
MMDRIPHEPVSTLADAFETIKLSLDAHVATLTLNRPDKLNAFNSEMALEISRAWEAIRDDDDVHAVLLIAAGDRAFCTGMDVDREWSWYERTNLWNTMDPGVALSPKYVHNVWKPVITAVHGMCAGGAQYFLNESDIIICSDDATFFDPHASTGIVSSLEPAGMLARGVQLGEVLRWALMGSEERITAESALRIGLVSEVVPRADLHARGREIASSIADRDPVGIQGTVRAIWEALELPRGAALRRGGFYPLLGNLPREARPPRVRRPATYR